MRKISLVVFALGFILTAALPGAGQGCRVELVSMHRLSLPVSIGAGVGPLHLAVDERGTMYVGFSSWQRESGGRVVSSPPQIVTKRMSDRWQLLGGLTIGRERGAFRGDLVYGFDDLNNPNFNINRKGIVGNDSPYIFKLAGTYQLPWGFEISGNFQHFTGYPLRRIFTVTTAHIPNLTQVSQAIDLVERGTVRLPNVNLLDLRISRIFAIGENWRIEPALDIFNVGNVATTTAEIEAVGVALGQPTVIVAPRLFKLGVKVNF